MIKEIEQCIKTPIKIIKIFSLKKRKFWKENEKSNSEESVSSSTNAADKLDSDYQPEDCISLRNQIKEQENDFKIINIKYYHFFEYYC